MHSKYTPLLSYSTESAIEELMLHPLVTVLLVPNLDPFSEAYTSHGRHHTRVGPSLIP
jgi:hypothetical protein